MARIQNLFLDRDGTIIVDKHYLSDPDGVELLPGAGQALWRMAGAGVNLFIVTNQSGIGRGYFPLADFEACSHRLADILRGHGIVVAGEAYCPHGPDDACDCRKPGLGMWRELAEAHGLDPATCAMIGDRRADIAFGLNAGFAASVLVRTGLGDAEAAALGLPGLDPQAEPAQALTERRPDWPHAQARDLAAACAWLLAQ
ncbi:MAG: D-glycero-alpha-D-manno-heptose-1,7-bisphosphate 7-phosphatase [Desulfovibrionaceae bacterium]